jgi:hypothetical protein
MGNCSSATCHSEVCCTDKSQPDGAAVLSAESIDFTKRPTSPMSELGPRSELHLDLEVISSNTLEVNMTFVLTPDGCTASLRQLRDRATYFGCKKRSRLEDGQKGGVVNDIVIPLDSAVSEMHRGRHFQISFDVKSESYFLQDLGVGFGCYLKLTQPITLVDEQLIQVGRGFVVLKLLPSPSYPQLEAKVYGLNESSTTFRFSVQQERSSVSIGRLPESDIPILDDDLLSKRQATVIWSSGHWLLADGDLEHPSTNGTW